MNQERALKIAIVGINFTPEVSGIAPYTSGLATGMADRGHHVRVLTTFPHYPQWRFQEGTPPRRSMETMSGVEVVRARHYVPEKPTGMRRALSEVSFGSAVPPRRWGQPDVLVCVSPALLSSAMAFASARWGRASRPALGLIMQDLYSAGASESDMAGGGAARILARLEAWAVHQADGVVVIHDRFKSRIEREFSVPGDKVTVIRNWTHLPEVQPFDRTCFRTGMGWSPEETVVLHTGAMGEKQGLSNVVAAARLAEHEGFPLRFVLVGDGGQRVALEAQAGDCANIEFLEPLPGDAYGMAMRSADILLVNERPGLVEMAVPSKLTSYFSSGVPVLAATEPNSTTADELAASGAGVRIGPGDPRALVTEALRLGEDQAYAALLGVKGPEYCESMLSGKASLDSFEAWVRRLSVGRRTMVGVK
ncbi:glycosyltransferase [Nocardioides psychrotolerans]|uniref:glycosyltransferase n=1 Tax=Nocardioides psychrotolerans TaxID=1005945 RepID=UPI0031377596